MIAVPSAFIYLGALFGAMAIILGRAGLQKANAGGGRLRAAQIGIALGVLSLVIVIVLLLD